MIYRVLAPLSSVFFCLPGEERGAVQVGVEQQGLGHTHQALALGTHGGSGSLQPQQGSSPNYIEKLKIRMSV